MSSNRRGRPRWGRWERKGNKDQGSRMGSRTTRKPTSLKNWSGRELFRATAWQLFALVWKAAAPAHSLDSKLWSCRGLNGVEKRTGSVPGALARNPSTPRDPQLELNSICARSIGGRRLRCERKGLQGILAVRGVPPALWSTSRWRTRRLPHCASWEGRLKAGRTTVPEGWREHRDARRPHLEHRGQAAPASGNSRDPRLRSL